MKLHADKRGFSRDPPLEIAEVVPAINADQSTFIRVRSFRPRKIPFAEILEDPALESGHWAKIQKQADLVTSRLQIVQELRLVLSCEFLGALDL
jgi:hypothetical protein